MAAMGVVAAPAAGGAAVGGASAVGVAAAGRLQVARLPRGGLAAPAVWWPPQSRRHLAADEGGGHEDVASYYKSGARACCQRHSPDASPPLRWQAGGRTPTTSASSRGALSQAGRGTKAGRGSARGVAGQRAMVLASSCTTSNGRPLHAPCRASPTKAADVTGRGCEPQAPRWHVGQSARVLHRPQLGDPWVKVHVRRGHLPRGATDLEHGGRAQPGQGLQDRRQRSPAARLPSQRR
jgi:hypothetical protein